MPHCGVESGFWASPISPLPEPARSDAMPLTTILIIILIIVLIGALPSWPYSRGWGYYPSGLLGLILIILIILALMGRL
jgi:hypothetical protein